MTRKFARQSGDQLEADLAMFMRRQLQIVEELLVLAAVKREAVLSRERLEIESAAAKQSRLLSQLAEVEAKRYSAVVNWARQQADLAPETRESPTLDDVLPSLSAQKAKEIRELADTLSKRLAELDESNKDNAGLIYYSLAVVQTMLGALTGDEARGAIYGPGSSNSAQEQSGKAILDWRA